MFRKTMIGAAILALASGAFAADQFTFDTNGAAGGGVVINDAVTFDWAPGNALAVGGTGLFVGKEVELLYQANLATIKNGANPADIRYTNGIGGNFFTAVAGFEEVVTNFVPLGGPTAAFATFDLAANPSKNFFYIYANSAGAASDLNGTGFTAGTRILEAHVVAIAASNFQTSNNTDDLDNFVNDDYPTIDTLTGAGSTTITAVIDFADSNYFTDLQGGTVTFTFTAFNNSQIVPFDQVDPSAAFSSDGIANGDVAHNIGTLNGVSGPNFQFQADANQSFTIQQVPEPSGLALVAVGLLGLGAFTRRRQAR